MLISEERSLWSTLYGLSSYYSQGRNKVNKIKGWIGKGFLLIYIPRYQCLLCQYYEACLFLFYFQIWLPLSSHVIQTREADNRDWTLKKWESMGFQCSPMWRYWEEWGRKRPEKRLSCRERAFNVWALVYGVMCPPAYTCARQVLHVVMQIGRICRLLGLFYGE